MKNDYIQVALFEWRDGTYVRTSPWYWIHKISLIYSSIPMHYVGQYIWCEG